MALKNVLSLDFDYRLYINDTYWSVVCDELDFDVGLSRLLFFALSALFDAYSHLYLSTIFLNIFVEVIWNFMVIDRWVTAGFMFLLKVVLHILGSIIYWIFWDDFLKFFLIMYLVGLVELFILYRFFYT